MNILSRRAALVALTLAFNAKAQNAPATMRFIVGNVPGGTNDIVTRIVASAVHSELRTTTVVENLSGASGLIAQSRLVSSAADGSTLLMSGANQVLLDVVNNTSKMKEMAPVAGVAGIPLVLVGRPSLEAKNIDELIAFIFKSEQPVTIAGGGSGTMPHMAAALLQQHAGLKVSYVPYRGAPNMLPDLMGGHIDLAVLVLPAALSSIKDGSVRAYGLFSTTKVPTAPELNLLSESKSLKGMQPLDSWLGLYLSAKTPDAVRQKIVSNLVSLLRGESVKNAIAKAGAIPLALDGAAVQRLTESDTSLYRDLIRANNLTFDR